MSFGFQTVLLELFLKSTNGGLTCDEDRNRDLSRDQGRNQDPSPDQEELLALGDDKYAEYAAEPAGGESSWAVPPS